MRVGKRNRPAGFTLVELLVTLAVMVIISTIAVPGFQGVIETNRTASDYNELLAGFNYARSEAVKQRADIAVTVTPKASRGWDLLVSRVSDSEALLVRSSDNANVASALTVTFNALGRSSCTSACQLSVASGAASKAIEINRMGRVGKPVPSNPEEESGT